MPMDFPDMNSLKQRARERGFRQPEPDETVPQYRLVFSNHVRPSDPIEAMEIATGLAWDKQERVVLLGNLLNDSVD